MSLVAVAASTASRCSPLTCEDFGVGGACHPLVVAPEPAARHEHVCRVVTGVHGAVVVDYGEEVTPLGDPTPISAAQSQAFLQYS